MTKSEHETAEMRARVLAEKVIEAERKSLDAFRSKSRDMQKLLRHHFGRNMN